MPAAPPSAFNLIKANTGTWTLTGTNTYTGTTTISGGTLQLGNGGTTGSLATSSAITNNATLSINRSNTVTEGSDFAATITGTGSLIKAGTGNLILNGANLGTGSAREVLTFSGANAGTVTLRNTAALGAAGNVVRFTGAGSGILDIQTDTSLNAYGITSGTFNGGTIIANRATAGTNISHALGVLDLSSVTMTINKGGNVGGTAAVSFTELRMSGGNDYNPVIVAGNADVSIGSASITNNGMSKRLQLDGTGSNNTVAGVISNTNNSTAGAVVNLIKANSGTWTISGTNTYTGTTTVNGGTLVINGNQAAATGNVTVSNANTKLMGTGTIGGATTINAGAIHAPGTGVGTQNFSTNLTYSDGSIFEWEMDRTKAQTRGTGYDAVNVTGDLTGLDGVDDGTSFDAKFRIVIGDAGFTDAFWTSNKTWTDIFTAADGSSPKSNWAAIFGGGFEYYHGSNSIAAPSAATVGYFTLSGNSLTWTAVPEPTGALAGLLVGAGLLRRRRA